MTGGAAEPPYDTGAWAALSRRSSPYLDPVLGLAAAALSVVSLLGTDLAAEDPRLEAADPLAVVATLVAGLSLAWRRTRPVAAFSVFVGGCLVVTLTGHYIGLLSVLLLLALSSLAAHGSRRAGVVGLVTSLVVFLALALLTSRTWARPTCCSRVLSCSPPGRSATPSGHVAANSGSGCGPPSSRP